MKRTKAEEEMKLVPRLPSVNPTIYSRKKTLVASQNTMAKHLLPLLLSCPSPT